jgi:RNA polymerase sigma-70 factor (ECF subfamily)
MAATPAPDSRTAPERAGDDLVPVDVRRRLPQRQEQDLAIFFEAYFERIYGYVRGLVHHEQLAEDLTQDVFLQIHRGLPSYDPARKLRPWVFTIAINRVRDHWRSRAHRDSQLEASLEGEDDTLDVPDEGEAPLEPLLRLESASELREAIDRLPEGMREVVALRVFEELSFDEIGKLLDRNEVAIRKRYSRALEALRVDLEAAGEPS